MSEQDAPAVKLCTCPPGRSDFTYGQPGPHHNPDRCPLWSAVRAGVDRWILDHAYAPDDIVLGDGVTSISDTWLTDLQELLDLARPGWRDLFGGKS